MTTLVCFISLSWSRFWIRQSITKWLTENFFRNVQNFAYKFVTAMKEGRRERIDEQFWLIVFRNKIQDCTIHNFPYFPFINIHSTSLYRAFISRLLLLTIVASLQFSYFTIGLLPTLTKSVDFRCSIGPLIYTCSGHPGKFYEYLGIKIFFPLIIFRISPHFEQVR